MSENGGKTLKKKLVSLILTLTLIFTCSIPAMAFDITGLSDASLTIDQSRIAVKIGETTQLTATLYGYTPGPVTWSIDNPSIATIDSNGKVTGKSLGIAVVTASADGMTATNEVNVVLKGIDIAHYQSDKAPIDWGQVKASGVDFAIIKATEGVDYIDPAFKTSIAGAIGAGMHVGAYHFLRTGDAAEQARQFIEAIKPYSIDYPVPVDVENDKNGDLGRLDKTTLTNMVITFCEAVRAAGYKPMVYTNPDWIANHLDMSRLSNYDLWLARYNHSPLYDGVSIWQYSSGTTIPGIIGNVDSDYSFVNYGSVLQSDTVAPYTFGANNTYIYKITTKLPTPPKATSSNNNAVSVAFYQKVSGGYLYKITNVNAGTATITTTASDGSSTSFIANGKPYGVVSDTVGSFNMKTGATYQMKLTLVGGATAKPTVATGNPNALKVVSITKSGNSYYVKLRAYAESSVGVYTTMPNQSSIRQCIAVISSNTSSNDNTGTPATSVISDTPAQHSMQLGATYQFKFSLAGGTAGIPNIATGNSSVLKIVSNTRVGSDFYVKVQGVQSGCTGVYTTLPGQNAVRQCVVTVS